MSKQIDWGDDSGDKISVEASEFSGNQVLRVTSQQNTRAYKRSIAIVVTSSSDPTKKATINLSQEAAPATLSLNVQSLVFSQRADSLEVQLTTNDNWQTSSNDDIPIPDEVTLKYNPWTDMVEMVGQPQQVYDAVEASDDYIMAMVRVGFSNVKMFTSRWNTALEPTSINTVIDIANRPNRGGMSYREFLLSNLDNPKYHRIIPRAYMREPGIVSIKQGLGDVLSGVQSQTYLYPDSALINKPGKLLGLRGCPLTWPDTLHLLASLEEQFMATTRRSWRFSTSYNKISLNLDPHTTSMKLQILPPYDDAIRFVAPILTAAVASRSSNGPIGYILYKKKGTSGYVVRGFDRVSNFALARVWVDESPYVSDDGKTMITRAHFGGI